MSTRLLVLLAFTLLHHLSSRSVCGSVRVEVIVIAVHPAISCADNLGLVETSILLYYRSISLQMDALLLSEWTVLAEVPLTSDIYESFEFVPQPEDVGVQLRVLQLEHGGGGCNCWLLDRLEVVLDDGTSLGYLPQPLCQLHGFPSAFNSFLFCNDFAINARGVVTRALAYNGTIAEDCPGDSNTTLISSMGPPLPASCDQVVPRM